MHEDSKLMSPAAKLLGPVSGGVSDVPEIPGHLHPLSFITRLKWRLDNDPPRQKSQRTRERLKLACAEFLNSNGIHELKAGDVSSGAGLAEGSFYLYFADKRDITRIVLSEFKEMLFNVLLNSRSSTERSDFESMRQANYIWVACARANAGLFRCMYQFSDEDPQFARDFQSENMRWNLRTMRATMRKATLPKLSESEVMIVVYLLAGMMDDLVRKLIVYPDDEMISMLRQATANDETIADVATLIWLRLLRPGERPPANLAGRVGSIAAALFPVV